jgi:saccharopine dehydrogenase (NAD+, L-lysine-forming)
VKLLILGAGGVGSAAAKIAARRPFLSSVVIADYDLTKTEKAAAEAGDSRFRAAQIAMRRIRPRSSA